MSARTPRQRAKADVCYFFMMGNLSLVQHREQPHHVGLALVSQWRQDPFQDCIVLDLCNFWQAIDIPFPSCACQQHSYCCIYRILKTTVVLTIILHSPNCPCSSLNSKSTLQCSSL